MHYSQEQNIIFDIFEFSLLYRYVKFQMPSKQFYAIYNFFKRYFSIFGLLLSHFSYYILHFIFCFNIVLKIVDILKFTIKWDGKLTYLTFEIDQNCYIIEVFWGKRYSRVSNNRDVTTIYFGIFSNIFIK